MSKKVLHIISSPREASVSRQLGDAVVEKVLAKYPGSKKKERNLAKELFPHLEESHINSFFTPEENRSAEQLSAVKHSDAAIAELQEADIIVIDAPVYNFSVPSTLKAYFDHIARAGVTFRYNEQGRPEGLLKNKKVHVSIASGGVYSEGAMQAYDFISPYIKGFLGFLGITDISFYRAEGLKVPQLQENALQKGIESIVVE